MWTNRRICIVPAALSYKTSLDLVDGWKVSWISKTNPIHMTYSYPRVTYSDPKVTYSDPNVNYSDPRMTYSYPRVTYTYPSSPCLFLLLHKMPSSLQRVRMSNNICLMGKTMYNHYSRQLAFIHHLFLFLPDLLCLKLLIHLQMLFCWKIVVVELMIIHSFSHETNNIAHPYLTLCSEDDISCESRNKHGEVSYP